MPFESDESSNHTLALGLMEAARHLAQFESISAQRLARLALSYGDDPKTLTAYIVLAATLFDPSLIKDAARRSQPYMEKSSELAGRLKHFQCGPLAAVKISERLAVSRPLAIDPIPGRTLYILHKSLPEASDGYATRSHGLVRGMLECGADLVCYTRPGFPYDLSMGSNLSIAETNTQTIDGVEYNRLASPKRSDVPPSVASSMVHASFRYLDAAADRLVSVMQDHRPSCVLAASNLATALPSCLAARRLGLPFIYEVRGFWELTRDCKEPGFLSTITGRQEKFLESALARSADRVVTLTSPMRQELVARGVEDHRLSLAPNACDPEALFPTTRDVGLAYQLGLPSEVPAIGYIGSFNAYEGLVDLVNACAQLREEGVAFRLVLVGSEPADADGAYPLTERIKRAAHRAGLCDWLIMPGRVAHSEVQRWYSLIDIAPFPRRSAAVTELVSPLKPLEALAMEKAVIVTDVGGMQEIVKDTKTGLVIARENQTALKNALRRLIQDQSLRLQLGKAGRDWVKQNRTWRASAKELLAAIDHVQ